MSENQVKDHIVEEVKIAKETGKITSKKIHEIVRKAVAGAVSEGKGGAKEAGALLPEEIGTRIESLSADIKLKSTELFGMAEQTVKEAVKQVYCSPLRTSYPKLIDSVLTMGSST